MPKTFFVKSEHIAVDKDALGDREIERIIAYPRHVAGGKPLGSSAQKEILSQPASGTITNVQIDQSAMIKPSFAASSTS